MGYWAELLVDELAARFPQADRDRLAALAQEAGTEIEMLAGQSFGLARRNSVSVDTCGLPLVELSGLLIGSQEGPRAMWPIPNPVDGQRATVVQVGPVPEASRAGPTAGYTRHVRRLRIASRGIPRAEFTSQSR